MINPIWVICTKCGSKFYKDALERGRQYACPVCDEPGLRIMDAKGEATDKGWPEREGSNLP